MRSLIFASLALTAVVLAPPALSQESVPDPYTGAPQAQLPGTVDKQTVAEALKAGAADAWSAAEAGSGGGGVQSDAPVISSRKPVQDRYAVPAQRPQADAAQEPDPPSGEPQPGGPDEPVEPVEPVVPEGAAGGGGTLPRTGLDALWYALGGIALIILGWRLHVVARVREVIRRLRTPKEALREELEGLLEAGAERERAYAANAEPPVEPATPGAKRAAELESSR